MAKRFTDTDKWKKPFLRGLEGSYKLLWFYILDDCDMAGIWQEDFEVAQIRIGEKLDKQKAISLFGDRIKIYGNKWLIVDFIQFQYGELKNSNRMHVAVMNTLLKNEIPEGASKPLTRGQGQGQNQGQGNEQGKEQGGQKKEDEYPSEIIKSDQQFWDHINRRYSKQNPESVMIQWEAWYINKFEWKKKDLSEMKKSYESWLIDPHKKSTEREQKNRYKIQ